MSTNHSFLTPHDIVRIEHMNEHFTKYHLGGGRVLHHFTKAEDVFYHDHPWPFRTTILKGGYSEIELLPGADHVSATNHDRRPGTTHEVQAGTIHKLTGLLDGDCWTLVEPGEKEREPGFYEPRADGLYHRYWHEPADGWQPWPRA